MSLLTLKFGNPVKRNFDPETGTEHITLTSRSDVYEPSIAWTGETLAHIIGRIGGKSFGFEMEPGDSCPLGLKLFTGGWGASYSLDPGYLQLDRRSGPNFVLVCAAAEEDEQEGIACGNWRIAFTPEGEAS